MEIHENSFATNVSIPPRDVLLKIIFKWFGYNRFCETDLDRYAGTTTVRSNRDDYNGLTGSKIRITAIVTTG